MTKKARKPKAVKPKVVKAKAKPKTIKAKTVTKTKAKPKAKEVKALQKFNYKTAPVKEAELPVVHGLPAVPVHDLPAVPARIGETFDLPDVPRQEPKPTEKQIEAILKLQKAYQQNKGNIKEAKARFKETHGIPAPTRAELAPYIKDLPAPEALIDPTVWKRFETRERNEKETKKASKQSTKQTNN